MASSSRSKRKASIEPITVDELMNAAGMSGFVSFLNVRPQEYRSAGPLAVERAVERPTVGDIRAIEAETPTAVVSPTVGASILPFPSPEALLLQRPAETPTLPETPTVPELPTVGVSTGTEIDKTPAVVETPTDLNTSTVGVSTGALRERIFRATTVQHGHSSGEQNLFQAMWSAPDTRAESTDSRLLTAGYDFLARLANLNEKSIRHALRALIAKLAIEVVAPEQCDLRRGRTYRIYSYRKVLERREAAGMTWVRKTRGVEFIPDPRETPTVGPSLEKPTVPVGETPTVSVGEKPTVSVGKTPTPLSSLISSEIATPPSVVVVAALRSHAPSCDDDVVHQLIRECRLRAPDATDGEIAHFIQLKARTPQIRMPLGFLLRAVPRCFEGESFRQFRREEDRRRDAEARERALVLEAWREILADPDSTEELRREARKALQEAAQQT